jgi:hypothetical protein
MNVKELKEQLSQFPDDAAVDVRTNYEQTGDCGISGIDYTEGGGHKWVTLELVDWLPVRSR